MTPLDDLKRACQEKLAHKKGDLYGREQLRADMDYSFATTPDKILSLIDSHEQLQAKLDNACEALEFIHLNFSKVTKCPDNTCDGCFMDAKIAAEKATKTLLEIRKKDDNG